jgi:hypothetical protein
MEQRDNLLDFQTRRRECARREPEPPSRGLLKLRIARQRAWNRFKQLLSGCRETTRNVFAHLVVAA